MKVMHLDRYSFSLGSVPYRRYRSMLMLAILGLVLLFTSIWMGSTRSSALATSVKTDHVEVELISEVESVQAAAPFWVALRFEIEEDWHLYWRNPGDSGAKLEVDWTLPTGFKIGEILWPYPERLPAGPLMNFGYEDEVLFLSEVIPPAEIDPAEPIRFQADASWLVCKLDCIPESGVMELALPQLDVNALPDPRWSEDFEQTRQKLPQPFPWPIRAELTPQDLILHMDISGLEAGQIEQVNFFPDLDGVIVNAAEQQLQIHADELTLQIQRGYLPSLEAVTGVVVIREQIDQGVVDQAFSIEAAVTHEAAGTEGAQQAGTEFGSRETLSGSSGSPAASASLPLWQVFGLAFLGGVILNLMPCVFPVLSIKALSIAHQAQRSPQHVRLQVLAFTGGVLSSFAGLAGTLLILRSFGQQIGWGFQLQSPPFVMMMAFLLFGVGLNLSGVFVVGSRLMGVGQRLTEQPGYLGEFFSGVLATVVATPCTAPFMATAIGAALIQPPLVAMAIFQALGLGLVLPYGAISLMPGLQQRLPKPGAWMETLQQLLAFPLYGAVAWLIWVLTQQAGTTALAAALTGMILIAMAAWSYQKTRMGSELWQRIGVGSSGILLGVALLLTQVSSVTPVAPLPSNADMASISGSSGSGSAETGSIAWEPYSPDRLEELRQTDNPVFVNFTADWCITCLVNERTTFSQPEVEAAFRRYQVASLKGDWTQRNPQITEALESFGRSGVPLYVLYPGGPADPILLPQLLSVNQITQAFAGL